jgi:hypothetical protein
MTQPDSKYVTSNRPVNRRTSAKPISLKENISPLVQERLAAMKAKSRFGVPLTEQLQRSMQTGTQVPLSRKMVAAGIVTALSLTALLLAAIQASGTMAIAGGVGLCCGLGLILHARRQVGHAVADTMGLSPIFEEQSLQSFDNALHQLSLEVSEEIAARLRELKQQIFRIAKIAVTQSVDENFALEDKHYLSESLRRYLPDSFQSYLLVPEAARTTQMITENQTAEMLLLSQIALLHTEFAKQEFKLNKSAAEQLLRQQRFLEAKTNNKM